MAVAKWLSRQSVVSCLALISLAAGPAIAADSRGLSVVSSHGAAGNYYENSWAVLIGIDDYENDAVSDLQYALSDVEAMHEALIPLGFPEEQIITLSGAEATRQGISKLLNERLRTATGPEDRVLVFFAGHGVTQELPRGGEEGYLLPVDADPSSLAATAFSMGEIRAISRRLPAKHILYVVDACYSGMSLQRSTSSLGPVNRRYLELVTSDPAVQILTAGSKDQPVIEENGHGVFTSVFLSALRGHADLDGNNILTADEVAAWVRPRVAQATDYRQTPQFGSLDGAGQFTFVLPGTDSRDPARSDMMPTTNEDSLEPSPAEPNLEQAGSPDPDETPAPEPQEPLESTNADSPDRKTDSTLPSGLPPF